MNKHAIPLVVALAAAGCVYPAERGKMLESRVERLEADKASMDASLLAQREMMEAQLPAIQETLAKLEELSRRSSASTGVQVEELQAVISSLRGQLEEQTFRLDQMGTAMGELKAKNEEQAEQIALQQKALEEAAARRTQEPPPPSQAEAAPVKPAEPEKGTPAHAAATAAANAGAASKPAEPEKDKAPEKPVNKADAKEFADAVAEKLKADPVAGRKLADEFLRKWPKHAQSARVHYEVGMSWMNEKNHRAALAEFGVFVQPDTPKALTDSKWAPEALLRSADCFAALKMEREATMALEEVVNGFPRSSAAKTAQSRLDAQKKKAPAQATKGKKKK